MTIYNDEPQPETIGFNPVPPQHRRRRGWRLVMAVLIGCFLLLIGVGIGSSTKAAPKPAPTVTVTASSAADPVLECQAQGGTWNGSSCDTSPSPIPTDSNQTGPVGTTFTVTNSDGTSYDVTLDKVTQHATLGQYDSLNNYQDHVAAAEFTITGDAGSSSDDANNDANAIGSNQVQYQENLLTDLPNFSAGEFKVAQGQTVKGWVTFELPPGVTLAQVQWAPGFNGSAATWTVSA